MSVPKAVIEQIYECNACEGCLISCPTYKEMNDSLFSPLGRVEIAKTIVEGADPGKMAMVESVYSCTMCYACNFVCPNGIDIVEIVERTRIELVRMGTIPFERQKGVINSILEKENALGRDPTRRLDWFPEKYEERESKTLLYLGCILSYIEKNIAVSSYLILKRAGVDFRILENEGCCGIYLYRAGNYELARKVFERNASRFKKLDIKRIIVPCLGCYRCFKIYYPKVIEGFDFEVKNIVEVIYELMKKGKLRLKRSGIRATYHDPCYLGRAEGIFDEPREILRACGVDIVELDNNRENATCCGAGAGVRSLFKDLSLKLAIKTLNFTPIDTIMSSCCFCTNQFKWAAREIKSHKKIFHITEIVLKSMIPGSG